MLKHERLAVTVSFSRDADLTQEGQTRSVTHRARPDVICFIWV